MEDLFIDFTALAVPQAINEEFILDFNEAKGRLQKRMGFAQYEKNNFLLDDRNHLLYSNPVPAFEADDLRAEADNSKEYKTEKEVFGTNEIACSSGNDSLGIEEIMSLMERKMREEMYASSDLHYYF